MILFNLIIGSIFLFPAGVMAEQPVWRGAVALHGGGVQKNHLSFQCPKAFLGVKGDMLPTHWQAGDRGLSLHLGHASIQDGYMVCTYRFPKNNQQRFGPVQRLVPRSYRCISDGIGSFRCQKKRSR